MCFLSFMSTPAYRQLNARSSVVVAAPHDATNTQILQTSCDHALRRFSSSFGDHSAEDPPVPIPNTAVKLRSANDTARPPRGKVGHRRILQHTAAAAPKRQRRLCAFRPHRPTPPAPTLGTPLSRLAPLAETATATTTALRKIGAHITGTSPLTGTIHAPMVSAGSGIASITADAGTRCRSATGPLFERNTPDARRVHHRL